MGKFTECIKCINTSANPSLTFSAANICSVCEAYEKYFDKSTLDSEFITFKNLAAQNTGKYNVLVGISGGKDSTATLYSIREMGLQPLAFTFDIGYYPKHIFSRSTYVADMLNIDHEIIDIRKYIREIDYECYKQTADLYSEEESESLKEKFKEFYRKGREHYSAKCSHQMPFVRSCQLCRRTVIRSYYAEAIRHNVQIVVLGINEWVGLSKTVGCKQQALTAIRKLQPSPNHKPVYIVHLPFLLQRKLEDTKIILNKIKWEEPVNENLVESNANSCLFGLAAEAKATRLLGFHPDSTRLAREVTAGFLSKEEARKALSCTHEYEYSVKEVLQRAHII